MWESRISSSAKKVSKLSLKCKLDAPLLIVPQSVTDKDANVLVADLGCLTFAFGHDDAKEEEGGTGEWETKRKVKEWFTEKDKLLAKDKKKKKRKNYVKSKCFANLTEMGLSLAT
eukprot:12517475-Ditylum_brightwellii.AAC.1